jgi:hypothetical protein
MYECVTGCNGIMRMDGGVNENVILESCDCRDRRISSRGQLFVDGTLGGRECIGRSVNHDSCLH